MLAKLVILGDILGGALFTFFSHQMALLVLFIECQSWQSWGLFQSILIQFFLPKHERADGKMKVVNRFIGSLECMQAHQLLGIQTYTWNINNAGAAGNASFDVQPSSSQGSIRAQWKCTYCLFLASYTWRRPFCSNFWKWCSACLLMIMR